MQPGHRVVLFLRNIPSFAVAYQVTQKIGAIAVSVNAMLTTVGEPPGPARDQLAKIPSAGYPAELTTGVGGRVSSRCRLP